jgi:hypothetical protein
VEIVQHSGDGRTGGEMSECKRPNDSLICCPVCDSIICSKCGTYSTNEGVLMDAFGPQRDKRISDLRRNWKRHIAEVDHIGIENYGFVEPTTPPATVAVPAAEWEAVQKKAAVFDIITRSGCGDCEAWSSCMDSPMTRTEVKCIRLTAQEAQP